MAGRYKHLFLLTIGTTLAAIAAGNVNHALQAQSNPPIICSYDPSSGVPNPLGMRTFITMAETDGTTEVTYEQLGSFVPGPVEAVLTSKRSLIFPNQSVDRVRQLLLSHDSYYQELVGFDDPDGFAAVNSSLICRVEAGVTRPVGPPERRSNELPDLSGPRPGLPADNSPSPTSVNRENSATFYNTIADLADGNYRYVSGPAEDRVYSDQELLSRGGVLFIFSKMNNEIIGSYSYIDGEAICVAGRVSGNTVSGQAYPYDGVARDVTEDFTLWGPAKFLKVRRTRGDEGERFYGSAILELNDFSRINAGSVLPPGSCD